MNGLDTFVPTFSLGETIIYKNGSTQTYTYVGRLGIIGPYLVQITGEEYKGVFYKLDNPEDYVKYVAPPEKGQTWRKKVGVTDSLVFVESFNEGFVVYSYAVLREPLSYYVRTLEDFSNTFEIVEGG